MNAMQELITKIRQYLNSLNLKGETNDAFCVMQIENVVLRKACFQALQALQNTDAQSNADKSNIKEEDNEQ